MNPPAQEERNVRRLRNDVDDIYDILGTLKNTLDGHTQTLAEHGSKLDDIGRRLDAHDARFDTHDARFDDIDHKLDTIIEIVKAN